MLKNLKDELNQIQQGVEQKQRELQQKINIPLPAQLREECAKSIVATAIRSLKYEVESNRYRECKKLLFKHYYYCGECRVVIEVTADVRQYKDFCYNNSVTYSTPPFYENSHGAECVPFIIPKNDFLQIRCSDSSGTYIQCRKEEDVFSIFERAKEIAKAEGFKAPRIKKSSYQIELEIYARCNKKGRLL